MRNNFKKSHVIPFLFLFSTVVLIFGCTTSREVKPAGFLDDYSTVERQENGLFVDRNSDVDLDSYSKLIIDPVVAVFGEDAKGSDIDPDTLGEFTDFLHDQLTIALKGRFEIVQTPQEGVLRLKTAITDVMSSKVLLNLHWSTTATGLGVGGAAMEAEFVDSLTDAKVIAIVDSRKGKRFKYFNGLSKWKHTKDVFKNWALLILELVENKQN